jgi:DNA-binding MarR family transcriptional regulator
VETCAGYNLRRTSRVVTSLFDSALEPTGLRSTQVAILQMIVVKDSPSIAKLAREMAMDPSTLTRNLRPLIREGYVELIQAERGRAKLARLTPAGRSKLDEVMARWKDAQTGFIKRFGSKRWNELRGELHAVVEAMNIRRRPGF